MLSKLLKTTEIHSKEDLTPSETLVVEVVEDKNSISTFKESFRNHTYSLIKESSAKKFFHFTGRPYNKISEVEFENFLSVHYSSFFLVLSVFFRPLHTVSD
jgi:hypothetical protein